MQEYKITIKILKNQDVTSVAKPESLGSVSF
jgi:hypothetical protein